MKTVLIAACATLLLASAAEAGTVTVTSGGRSAELDYTLGSGYVDLTLTNTTGTTLSAADLLTGVRFRLGGVTAKGALKFATADIVDVAKDGTVSSSGTDVDLLDIGGKPSWELVDVSTGVFELRFNPDAKHAIIGPAQADGTYSKANSSVRGNPGHNPYADGTADFRVTATGISSDTSLGSTVFLFGTDLDPVAVVPVPSAVWGGLLLLSGLGLRRTLRRRR